jgi:hypothetical protein
MDSVSCAASVSSQELTRATNYSAMIISLV